MTGPAVPSAPSVPATFSPTFDRDAYLAAVAPPVFIADGRRYVGRVLSWEEWLPIEAVFDRAARKELDQAALRAAVRLVCDTMFPPEPAPRWRWLLAGAARAPSVYALVRALPFAGQLAAIKSFAERQAEIQRGPRLTDQTTPATLPATDAPIAPQTPTATHGTPSPA